MRWGEIEYAKAGEHHIAYREVVGDDDGGDQEIVMVNAFNIPMDSLPQDPIAHRLLEGLAGLGRLVVFDRRGIALSDPVTDWETPLWEQWAEDLAAVVTASGCERPTVFSWHNAPVARACSVRYPDLIGRLVLFNASTPPTDADAEWIAEWVESTTRLMNGEPQRDGDQLVPRRAADPEFKAGPPPPPKGTYEHPYGEPIQTRWFHLNVPSEYRTTERTSLVRRERGRGIQPPRNSRPSKSPELRHLSMYSKYAAGPAG